VGIGTGPVPVDALAFVAAVWSLCTLAMLVMLPVAVVAMLYVAVTVTVPGALSVARLQGNPLVQGGVADTNVKPAGVGSVNITLVAAPLPVLPTTIV
jgi:hypothetical protein